MRHWIVPGMTVAAAMVMGLGLGAYVTRPQSAGLAGDAAAVDIQSDESGAPGYAISPADHGPGDIRCTGCGPSLADRRRARDAAGLDADAMINGTSDPVVRDYLSQGDGPDAALPAPSPPAIAFQPTQAEAVPATIATAAGDTLP